MIGTLLNNEYVIFAMVAIVIFAVYMAVVAMLRKDPMRERLKRVTQAMDMPGVGYAYEESKSPLLIFFTNVLTALGVDLAKAKREYYLSMARAGLMSSEAVVYLLFFRRFIQPVFLLGAVLVILRMASLQDAGLSIKLLHVILAGVFLVIGLRGTGLYLTNCTEKRQKVLQKSFPDALDLLLVCIESGLPLDSALSRVCREMKKSHPVITEELDRARIELNVLNDRIQALQNLADRTNTHGFKALVSALIQTEKVGSSIGDTLRTLSDEFRVMRMLQAENKAARIPALITVPLIFFIMPAFMLIVMGPPLINMFGG